MELTEQEIREGCLLLAEFDGMIYLNELSNKYPNGILVYDDEENDEIFEPDDLEYHTSYDWLMPVWVKFRDMESELNKLNVFAIMEDFIYHFYMVERALTRSKLLVPIQAFRALVSAVKWLNSIDNK